MHTDKHQNEDIGQNQNTNGVVTVNDENNPTPEQRDDLIGKEADTDRLRSERESVQDAKRSNQ